MIIPPADQACPVDLDYPDAEPPWPDLPAIIRRGQRVRRRRRLTGAGTAVAACALVAGLVVLTRGPAGPRASEPGTGTGLALPALQQLLAMNPPATWPVTLYRQEGWTAIAWATQRGTVCWAAAPAPGTSGATSSDCDAWNGADIPREGGQGLSSPRLALSPSAPAGQDLVPTYGLTTPAASRVVLTFFGHDFSARTVRLKLASGREVGVFLVFVRVPADANGYRSSDVSREVAYNQAGQVVASHGRWP